MSAINTNKSIRVKGQRHLDDKYFDPSTNAPYLTTADVLAKIGANERVNYLKVNIAGVDYWLLPDGSLVQYIGSLSLVDGSVTLVKMANVATSTVFYRKSAGDGPPEVQTLATLRADLNIPTDLDPALYVKALSGYSLAPNAIISAYPIMDAAIAALPTTYVAIEAGFSLISTDDLNKLASLFPILTMTMPAASIVANRVAGMISGTDYPADWTIAASGDNPNDLLITHNLGRDIVDVIIYSVSGAVKTKLYMNQAYSALVANDTNNLLIKNLATIGLPLMIKLIF